jgi:hypothetical protein
MYSAICIAVVLALSAPPDTEPAGSAKSASLDSLDKYLQIAAEQRAAQYGVQIELRIRGALSKLHKQGELHAVRSVSCSGETTYQALDFTGDNLVRQEVIARYLAAENQASNLTDIAVTPANYRFRSKGAILNAGRRIEMFQLSPRKKRVGLFKGELWLDGQIGAPVHEAGQFVRSPSLFIKRTNFVRDFETRDGLVIPLEVHIMVDTRMAGRAELEIHFINLRHESRGCSPDGIGTTAARKGDTLHAN